MLQELPDDDEEELSGRRSSSTADPDPKRENAIQRQGVRVPFASANGAENDNSSAKSNSPTARAKNLIHFQTVAQMSAAADQIHQSQSSMNNSAPNYLNPQAQMNPHYLQHNSNWSPYHSPVYQPHHVPAPGYLYYVPAHPQPLPQPQNLPPNAYGVPASSAQYYASYQPGQAQHIPYPQTVVYQHHSPHQIVHQPIYPQHPNVTQTYPLNVPLNSNHQQIMQSNQFAVRPNSVQMQHPSVQGSEKKENKNNDSYEEDESNDNIGAYKCQICSKVLKTRVHLRRHMHQIHQSNPKFVCEFCQKTFRRKDNLKCHLRIHSGEQPFECKICQRRFRFKSGYSFHMKNQHQREESSISEAYASPVLSAAQNPENPEEAPENEN
jgi:hypothetical protein